MSEVGDMILESLREYGEALESGEPLERRLTVRTYRLPPAPRRYDGPAVQAVREAYQMSQGVFARFLGVPAGTLRSWEQGRRPAPGVACRLLDELAASPEHFRARFAALSSAVAGADPGAEGIKGDGRG